MNINQQVSYLFSRLFNLEIVSASRTDNILHIRIKETLTSEKYENSFWFVVNESGKIDFDKAHDEICQHFGKRLYGGLCVN